MIKKYSLAVSLLAFLPWSASAQDAKSVVASAAKAMGVQDLNALGSYMYSGTGATFEMGRGRTPSLPWPKSELRSYRRAIDFDARGSLEIIARVTDSGSPETLRIPFLEPYGKPGKQYEIWITPLAFLKAAADGDATVKPATVAGKQYSAVSFTLDKYKITGYINKDNLLERVETHVEHPLLGDMLIESVYSGYQDFHHGLIFPSKVIESQGGSPVLDLTVTDAVANAVVAVIQPIRYFTDRSGTGGEISYHGRFLGAPPPIGVDETLLNDSVHYMKFYDDPMDARNSVVVEFNDYLVVIEAPVDETRSKAVIAAIRQDFGSKPIRYVVNTHAHFEVAGGLKAYAAEGATIITQEINKPFFDKVLAQVQTKSKKKVVVEGVAEKRILTDGTHVIELYHLQNAHSDGMLVAYLPKDKMVVQDELYTVKDPETVVTEAGEIQVLPKGPVSPYAAELVESLDRLKIDYQTILCLPGRAAPKTELLEDVKKSAAK